MKSHRFAILGNELEDDSCLWVSALLDLGFKEYSVINLTKSDWLVRLNEYNPTVCLNKPGGYSNRFKHIFDQRLYLIVQYLKIPVYPSLDEVLIYENKAYFYEWLKINNLPSAETWLFYHLPEALIFAKSAKYPIVAKLNIGASGDGVSFLKNPAETKLYLETAFHVGIKPRSGPKLKKGKIIQRAVKIFFTPGALQKKIFKYKVQSEESQKGFVIFQEFIPHEYEWRVVRIGESFFAHKKLIEKNKASGSLLKNYDDPPLDLFEFVKKITDKYHLYSQAVDVFESENKYIINEMQCIFGQSDSFQMLVGGKPGRYTKIKGVWEFEEGDFNKNESYNLRVAYIVDKMDKQ